MNKNINSRSTQKSPGVIKHANINISVPYTTLKTDTPYKIFKYCF